MSEDKIALNSGEKRTEDGAGLPENGQRRKKKVKNQDFGPPEGLCPQPGHCGLYLFKKKRFCRQLVHRESKFCAEHGHSAGGGDPNCRKRVPCPLDSKHSCFEDNLQRHLKVCAANMDQQPAYKPYCNGPKEPNLNLIKLSAFPQEDLIKLIDRVKEAANKLPDIAEDIRAHESMQSEIDKPMNGAKAQKHLQQNSSLVSHLEKEGLLEDGSYYVEFGAGKGGMSHWVQRAMPSSRESHFLLVEKAGMRYKMDSYHRGEDQGPDFERLKMDIQHFDLSQSKSLKEHPKPVIGIGKHLCGGATDLMLRCLMDNNIVTAEKGNLCEGLVLALCCHHRCTWGVYVGQDYFTSLGFSPQEAHLIYSMSTWATDGTLLAIKREKESQNESKDEKRDEIEETTEEIKPELPQRHHSLTPEVRESIGYMCKNLIDHGRVQYLQNHGYDTHVVAYTSLELSRENKAIIALKNHSNAGHSR